MYLLCRARDTWCALPLSNVVEIMRPLPIEAVSGAPRFVSGVAIVRGAPTPVIDCGALLSPDADGPRPALHKRWAALRCDQRNAVLAFEEIAGVRSLRVQAGELPPLLASAASDAIEAITTLDAALLLVLRSARLVPEVAWQALEPEPVPA